MDTLVLLCEEYDFEFVLKKLKTCLDLDYDYDSKGPSAPEIRDYTENA